MITEVIPSMETLVSRPPATGRVFFVHGFDGDDANNGVDPATPFKTIEKALGQCVNDRNDYIYVLDCYQQETTWPIHVNKSRVHIIGIGSKNAMYPRMVPPGDTAVFDVSVNYCEIAGFGLGAGVSHACIEFNTANTGRAHIHDCWFGVVSTCQDGIKTGGAIDIPELLIEDCWFGIGAQISNNGIYVIGNVSKGVFRRNYFRCSGLGIYCGLFTWGRIQDNRFDLPSDTEGKAITLGDSVTLAFVDGNHANYGDTAMTENPFKDSAPAGSNTWGLNYKGNSVTYPA